MMAAPLVVGRGKATILDLGDQARGDRSAPRRGLMAAVAAAWRAAQARADVVVAPVSGGQAGLIGFTPVVTMLDGEPAGGSALQAWLERRQTRHSRLVYAADRQTAVAFALRWRLDLARIRIAPGGRITADQIERELASGARARRSWHST